MNKYFKISLLITLFTITGIIGFFIGIKQLSKETDNQTFYAIIEEINDNTILVNGIDENDINYRTKYSFNVKTDTILEWRGTKINLSDLNIGDRISITFNGPVLDSYPGQLSNVIKIQLLNDREIENHWQNQSENSVNCNITDFEMSFYTNKKVYKTTEKIKALATFKYVGTNDSIKIWHASSYMIFTITDGKDFNVNGAVNMILKSSTLDKGKLYYFNFQKSGGWEADGPDADFWEKFYNEKDLLLPKGEYTIAAKASFSLTADSQDKSLFCELKIKVEE